MIKGKILHHNVVGNTVNPEIFARILFSQIALKKYLKQVKYSRLGHDLPISVNNRVI